jgi:hypothetical protein
MVAGGETGVAVGDTPGAGGVATSWPARWTNNQTPATTSTTARNPPTSSVAWRRVMEISIVGAPLRLEGAEGRTHSRRVLPLIPVY